MQIDQKHLRIPKGGAKYSIADWNSAHSIKKKKENESEIYNFFEKWTELNAKVVNDGSELNQL